LVRVRVSVGTLAAAGLESIRLSAEPGLAYIMQYSDVGCLASCAFCPQARTSRSPKNLLSRVLWPEVTLTAEFLTALARRFSRACLQSVIKEGFIEELREIVRLVSGAGLKVSLSVTPLPRNLLKEFRNAGVDYLGVGLDAASEDVAKLVRKPYSWGRYWEFIRDGVSVFGRGHVIVHIIVGLGEAPEDLLNTITEARDAGADVSLFAFTPVRGTPLYGVRGPPNLRYYRFAQIAAHLIIDEGLNWRDFTVFRGRDPLIRRDYVDLNNVWRYVLVRGCPGCNRPFYTESPAGERMYNYPTPEFATAEAERIRVSVEQVLA